MQHHDTLKWMTLILEPPLQQAISEDRMDHFSRQLLASVHRMGIRLADKPQKPFRTLKLDTLLDIDEAIIDILTSAPSIDVLFVGITKEHPYFTSTEIYDKTKVVAQRYPELVSQCFIVDKCLRGQEPKPGYFYGIARNLKSKIFVD